MTLNKFHNSYYVNCNPMERHQGIKPTFTFFLLTLIAFFNFEQNDIIQEQAVPKHKAW